MNTVFVVQDDCCGGCGNVHAVRATREAAEAYIAAHQPSVTHTLSIQDYELDPPQLQRGQRFWFQGAEWKLYGTVNECDGQAFMEDRGHDEWGARNLHTGKTHVFYEGFLIDELGLERPASNRPQGTTETPAGSPHQRPGPPASSDTAGS